MQTGTVALTGTFANFSGSTLTGGTYNITSTFKFPSADIVTNAATIVLDGVSSQIQNTSSVNAFTNFATNGSSGSFTVQNSRTITTSGAFGNAGTLTVGSGSSFTAGANYTQTAGTTTVNGTLTASSTVDVQGGSLVGSGTISANLSNGGTVGPGTSAGTLSVSGNYTQTASGTLNIELGGTTVGTQYDRLAIAGTATLDGAISASFINSFTPALNNAFQALTYASKTGTFATTSGLSVGTYFSLTPTYNASDFTLSLDPKIIETVAATGLSGASTVASGSEVQLFAVGLVGDGSSTVNSVALTLSDLSVATGLTASDLSALRLYRSTDATLDGSDTQIGSQSSISIGSTTTISATTPDAIPFDTQRYYLVSAVANNTVTDGRAAKVGFAANGVATSLGGKGTAVSASDANNTTIDVVASQLVLTTVPADTRAVDSNDEVLSGQTFQTQPIVQAKDANGNLDLGFVDQVTAALSAGGGTLLGTASATASNGVATFADLGYRAASDGEAFALQFDDAVGGSEGDLAAITTAGLSADVVAAQLVLIQEPNPTTVPATEDFAVNDVQVAVRDASGLVDTDYATAIALAAVDAGSDNAPSSGGSLTASPGTSLTPNNGVASWSELRFSANDEIELRFSSGSLPAVNSAKVTIEDPPAPTPPPPPPPPAPTAEFSGPVDTLDFGEVAIGATKILELEIHNIGPVAGVSQPLSFTGARSSRFSAGAQGLMIEPGQKLRVPIDFAPTEEVAHSVYVQLDFGTHFLETLLLGQGGAAPIATESSDESSAEASATDSSQTTSSDAAASTEGASQETSGSASATESGAAEPAATAPQLVAEHTAIAFDDMPFAELPRVGARVERQWTLSNVGTAPLEIASIAIEGTFFAVSTQAATVAAGESLQLVLSYAPATEGTHQGALVVHSDDAVLPKLQVPLTGATLGSRGPKITAEVAMDLGAVFPGESGRGELRVHNAGDELLTVDSIAVAGGEFAVVDGGKLSIASGESAALVVSFAGGALGEFAGILHLYSDDPVHRDLEVALSARVELPPAGPVALDFDLAAGDQQAREAGPALPGAIYAVQLNVRDAPPINGWSATIEYDPQALRYVDGSFAASDFIPGLLELVDALPGRLSVGGTVLDQGVESAGTRTLGQLSFAVLAGEQEQVELAVVAVSFRREGADEILRVRSTATINRRDPATLLPGDFDGDDQIGFADFFLFADAFGSEEPRFDLDGSGRVDFIDFFVFADFFGGAARAKLMTLARERLGLPAAVRLEPNYPNPFNAATTIAYALAQPGRVELAIFDIQGQKVRTLVGAYAAAGVHRVNWDGMDASGRRLATGTYLLQLKTATAVRVQKVLLVK